MQSIHDLYQHFFSFSEYDFDIEELIKKAKKVLDKNWTGTFTVPAGDLYPHQWSWDSAFIAIGYAHYNQERAQQEMRRLFTGQWGNGMVPQIVFNNDDNDTDYFPDADFWQPHRSPLAPKDPDTSGICQPPIHATALLFMLENSKDREEAQRFAVELFPKLRAWHYFLYRERDPNDEGLVYIRHPWASGMDNSPTWDNILKKINPAKGEIPDYKRTDNDGSSAERPSDLNYDRYVYLLSFSRERDYDEFKIREDGCPFLVQDILFNSVLCRAGRDLAQIAEWLGEDPTPFQQQARKTADAINNKLWDEDHNIYLDYDLVADERIEDHSLAGFLPLFADVPSPARAEKMFGYLDTGSFCTISENCLALPSYDRHESDYDSKKYWRGPIWMNLNWMLYRGLARYGHKKYVNFIKQSIIYLSGTSGFYEHYDPENGKGYGADDFSWSAALFLDVVDMDPEEST